MLKIDVTHHTFMLKDKIALLSHHFLEQHGFNYFQYLRCYQDGSVGLLTNHTGLFELMSTVQDAPAIFSSFTSEHQQLHSYSFLWDEELPSLPVSLARERFGFYHGLTIVKRYRNHYDMIAFAMSHPVRNPGSYFYTKHNVLDNFVIQFEKKNHDVFHIMDNNSLKLPIAYRDVNYQKLCLGNQKIEINTSNGIIQVTPQEARCLHYYLKGESYKSIAQLLNVSPRTVETYIVRLKGRIGNVSGASLRDTIY